MRAAGYKILVKSWRVQYPLLEEVVPTSSVILPDNLILPSKRIAVGNDNFLLAVSGLAYVWQRRTPWARLENGRRYVLPGGWPLYVLSIECYDGSTLWLIQRHRDSRDLLTIEGKLPISFRDRRRATGLALHCDRHEASVDGVALCWTPAPRRIASVN